tara:strand:- start:2968 stop:3309 length:342 start_codon:yes stop_codon:yes gene_type:complete
MIRENRNELVVVLTTFPGEGDASTFSRILIEEGLAACVQRYSACRSIYEWQGRIEETVEIPLVIKTMSDCLSKLKERIGSLHPYEIPELVVLETRDSFDEYRRWVSEIVDRRV